jgi:hypothetical protein
MILERWLFLLFPIFLGACAHRDIPYAKLAHKLDKDSFPRISYEGTEGKFHFFVYRDDFIDPIAELVGDQKFKIRDDEFLHAVPKNRTEANGEPKWYSLFTNGHRDFYQDFPPLNPMDLPQRAQQYGADQPEKRSESIGSPNLHP